MRLSNRAVVALAALGLGLIAATLLLGGSDPQRRGLPGNSVKQQPSGRQSLSAPRLVGWNAGRPSAAPTPPDTEALPPGGKRLRVWVKSAADGAPVAGARVWLVADGAGVLASAASGADGVAMLDTDAHPEPSSADSGGAARQRVHQIVVRQSGYELGLRGAPWPPSGDLTVELQRGASIRGKVVSAQDRRPVAGTRVFAVRAQANMRGDLWGAAADPRLLAVETGADGAFELEGLKSDGVYDIGCCGAGWASVGLLYGVRVGGDAVEVRASAVYGAYVVLTDPEGRTVAFDRPFDTGEARREQILPQGRATMLEAGSWFGRAIGVPAPSDGRAAGSGRLFLAHNLAAQEVDAIDLRYLLAQPGWEPIDVVLPLERAIDSIPTYAIRLRPVLPLARVKIALRAPDHLLRAECADEMVGQLQLFARDAKPWVCVVYGRDLPVMTLDGVPASLESARLLPAGWPHLRPEDMPSATLRSGWREEPDAPAATLDLTGMGTVRVELAGAKLRGTLELPTLSATVRRAGEDLDFTMRLGEGNALCVHCLPPGRYTVLAETETPSGTIRFEPEDVVVPAGGIAEVALEKEVR